MSSSLKQETQVLHLFLSAWYTHILVYILLLCDTALRWLREDVHIPDSLLYITLSDFKVIFLGFSNVLKVIYYLCFNINASTVL